MLVGSHLGQIYVGIKDLHLSLITGSKNFFLARYARSKIQAAEKPIYTNTKNKDTKVTITALINAKNIVPKETTDKAQNKL